MSSRRPAPPTAAKSAGDRKSTRLTPVTPRSTLFPYTTLFRSETETWGQRLKRLREARGLTQDELAAACAPYGRQVSRRSEEHTSDSSHTEIYTLSLHDALPI